MGTAGPPLPPASGHADDETVQDGDERVWRRRKQHEGGDGARCSSEESELRGTAGAEDDGLVAVMDTLSGSPCLTVVLCSLFMLRAVLRNRTYQGALCAQGHPTHLPQRNNPTQYVPFQPQARCIFVVSPSPSIPDAASVSALVHGERFETAIAALLRMGRLADVIDTTYRDNSEKALKADTMRVCVGEGGGGRGDGEERVGGSKLLRQRGFWTCFIRAGTCSLWPNLHNSSANPSCHSHAGPAGSLPSFPLPPFPSCLYWGPFDPSDEVPYHPLTCRCTVHQPLARTALAPALARLHLLAVHLTSPVNRPVARIHDASAGICSASTTSQGPCSNCRSWRFLRRCSRRRTPAAGPLEGAREPHAERVDGHPARAVHGRGQGDRVGNERGEVGSSGECCHFPFC